MRAFSAVKRPSASQPAHASMRIGWRLGWTRSDSSRLNVHFTGRSSNRAASAVRALVGAVFLAAERAAVGHEVHHDLLLVDAEYVGHLAPVVPHALTARPHLESLLTSLGIGHRGRERRTWFEERLFDALRLENLVGDVRAAASVASTSPCVQADRDSTLPSRPHTASSGSSSVATASVIGRRGRNRRRPHRPRRVRSRVVAGDHEREDVTGVRRAPTDGNEYGPVAVDQPDLQFAGHVGRGDHADDTLVALPPRSCRS